MSTVRNPSPVAADKTQTSSNGDGDPSSLPGDITAAQTTEEEFLRQIFVRDQMAEWSATRSSWPGPTASTTGTSTASATSTPCRASTSSRSATTTAASSRPSAAARHAALLAADARHQPGRRAAGQPARRAGARRPVDAVKFQCGGSEVTEAAIKLARQYHKLTGNARQVQDHQPLPVVARLDARLAVGLRPEGRARRSTSRSPPGFLHVFPPTCYRCPFGKTLPRRAASPAPRSSAT